MKLLAIIIKEWLVLWRDKMALVMLFLMPLLLIFIVSLLQAGDVSHTGKVSMLLINHDSGPIAHRIINGIKSNKNFQLHEVGRNLKLNFKEAHKEVAKGKYQALMVIPKGASESIMNYTRGELTRKDDVPKLIKVQLYFDPALPEAVHEAISSFVSVSILTMQSQAMANVVGKMIDEKPLQINKLESPVEKQYASIDDKLMKPNPLQQNVPAWTLFGMFFIIIPLAGVVISDRKQGISRRISLMPVYRWQLLLGRVVAYACVNMIQLILMFTLSSLILPLFGMTGLNAVDHIGSTLLIGLFISLGATGLGVMIGTWIRTYEQASALGPILIVIAAAIGGIMVPPFMMPSMLQKLSFLSPLYWGQEAFLNVYVRDSSLVAIIPNLIQLLLFFVATLFIAWLRPRKHV